MNVLRETKITNVEKKNMTSIEEEEKWLKMLMMMMKTTTITSDLILFKKWHNIKLYVFIIL